MADKTDFYEYYERAIHLYSTGFKHIAGGTGLGKTSIIPKVVKHALQPTQKAIYVANRIQLLKEMAATEVLQPHEIIWMRRNLDLVLTTLEEQRKAFEDLIDHPIFVNLAVRAAVDLQDISSASHVLDQWRLHKDKLEQGLFKKELEKQADTSARRILKVFKEVLKKARNTEAEGWLLDHPVTQSLFPFIAFSRQPGARLLLITLQKAYHGCFDGQRTMNLTHWKNYVVFMDEFDFSEPDLSTLICESREIDHVFKFVEYFYREMTYHKLPLPAYPLGVASNIQKRIHGIVNLIKALKLRFPQINQFTMSSEQRPAAIFRTSHIISTGSLWLKETERAYDIIQNAPSQKTRRTFRADKLFRAVGGAAERILTLFKELEQEVPIIYEEMKRQCYGGTEFERQIDLITHFPRKRQSQRTHLSSLLRYGYNIYDIYNLSQRTDPDEVKLRHYSMYTTPENILLSLVINNLVFALSATADIPRCVHQFDLSWLKEQPGVNYINLDERDIALIKKLSQQKEQARNTQLQLLVESDLNSKDAMWQSFVKFVEAVAKDPDFAKGPDSSQKHQQRRILRFFEILNWIVRSPQEVAGLSHLVFINSFRQIRLILERYGSSAGLFTASRRRHGRLYSVYDIVFQGQDFIVVFYNADEARRRQTEADEDFNALFREGHSVLVVTQYSSAGNGVNLQYKPFAGKDTKSDFLNLHLLETPYFYFGNPATEDDPEKRTAIIKRNIWYQAKLYAARHISTERFRYVLSTFHQPHDWNQRYQRDTSTRGDALLNQLTTLIQAIGRIEREWHDVPQQTIRMSSEVYDIFYSFVGPEYDMLRLSRADLVSPNLNQVLTQIEESIPQREYMRQDNADSRLKVVNRRCSEAIHRLVHRLEAVRQGLDERPRQQWEMLRHAVLQHDFESSLLRDLDCVYRSQATQDGKLWLNAKDEIIPAPYARHGEDYLWYLNAIYDRIAQNGVIRNYFSQHGYQLSFILGNSAFFVPYCYQAILAGALGEEACRALLRHHKIPLEEMSHALFEITDLKIKDQSIYIDCKYYTDATMERYNLPETDPLWHPKLNTQHFEQRAQQKLAQIEAITGEKAQLIYLNVLSYQERPIGYYDANFQPVHSYEAAKLIVVQGCLNGLAPNELQGAFDYLLHDLHTIL